jgi:uncharacterized membrane protein
VHGWDPLIGSHAVAATLAVVLGALQLARRRFGDRLHRWNGRAWVALTLYVAVTSFWIRDLRPGSFSWIHILSVITIVSIVAALVAIRRGDRVTHAISMTSTYAGMIGALIGVVAVPTRLVPRSFQADWTGMTLLTAVLVAAALGGVGLLSLAARRLRGARVRR